MKVEQTLDPHTSNNIKKTIRVASLASITTDLKSKPKIIKGRNNPIIEIDRLIEYNNLCTSKLISGFNNMIAMIIAIKISGILRNIKLT
ncbi:hypothetical protein FEC77_01635 [Rickettsia parkeri]|uniref:hypothetical protein n=1 Tax=Rickettsia parkeri TaxID=35792 RepID=UPI000169CA5C|nr:hypothetical protein [Rickettsia parkeri]QCS23996.1 hypothetical protein FEC77_01635 [Rickettsia parkeri]QWB86258.1 hypothetical protein JRD95_00304 [Rickettsia parkeri]